MGRNLGKLPMPGLSRLMEAYGVSGLSELAIAIGTADTTVRNWHARNTVPIEWYEKAAVERGVTLDWLIKGKEPIFLANSPLQVKKSATAAHLPYPAIPPPQPLEVREKSGLGSYGAQPIPIYKLSASAGNGNGLPDATLPDALIHFAPAYMRRHFGRVGDGFAMLYVKGDSMQPTLFDGDEIVIDTRERRVDRDGIYVVTVRADLKVKRIQVKMDGSLVIKSDNAAYEPELICAAQADEFQVEGRLVWPRLR
jgi:phage repressor protein C with HTH and peptisase S24 domain